MSDKREAFGNLTYGLGQTVAPVPESRVCPSCGYCPTCGQRRPRESYQFMYNYPYTADNVTYASDGTPIYATNATQGGNR